MTMMENIDNFIRCHPFSDAPYTGCKQCCNKMALVLALTHNFKCHTCLHRKDTPEGIAPIFPADKCTDEHFGNNHIITCLICRSKVFHGTWSRDKASVHITECIVKATYNLSRPYVCTYCLETLWLK